MTQAPYPMPGAPVPFRPRKPGPGLRVSLSLMAIGAVIAVASAIAIVIPLVGSFTSPVYSVPGDLHLHLKHARYTVYQRTGTSSGFGSIKRDDFVSRIDPSLVSVTAPDGSLVPVSSGSENETINRGSAIYTGSLVLDAPVSGDYDIRFENPNPTTVIVARSIVDSVRSVLVWFATGAIGGILFLTGLVMLIVGTTRRGRARRALQMGYGPAGWGQPGWGQPGWSQPPPYGPPPSPGPSPPGDPWAPPPP